MGKFVDLTGQRFGRLTVIERVGTKYGQAAWLCQCGCGNCSVVVTGVLRSGRQRSCGCYRSETTTKCRTKHGGKHERLYKIWKNIKTRCTNPNIDQWRDYGGRGIKMCEEWATNYDAFRAWALQNGYDESAKRGDCTIDRIDVNGNYEPSNCRWVNMKVQNNNQRSNKHITFCDETHTLAEWSALKGIKQSTLLIRLKHGWPVERALTEPVKQHKKRGS